MAAILTIVLEGGIQRQLEVLANVISLFVPNTLKTPSPKLFGVFIICKSSQYFIGALDATVFLWTGPSLDDARLAPIRSDRVSDALESFTICICLRGPKTQS
jgi:hypothetical protein